MQTILGANGIIAQELSKHLPKYTHQVRQVSRHPKKINPSDELVPADLLSYEQTEKAIFRRHGYFRRLGISVPG